MQNTDNKNTPGERKPVAEKFEKFEENYGGDAVNAHDNRMDTLLHENAEKLDDEFASDKKPDA